VIRRASLLCEDNSITRAEIQKILRLDKDDKFMGRSGDLSDYSLALAVSDAEKFAILRALKKTAGKKVKAAALLGIDYKTLVTKMEKYAIQ
jgi:transcriptional regulator of acetoin/glycerol metabolism